MGKKVPEAYQTARESSSRDIKAKITQKRWFVGKASFREMGEKEV
jgi:hypothetical protein